MASNPRLSILRNRSDFLYIVKKGQRVYPADWLVFNFVVNSEGKMRCGWTLPRQVGPAVVRNRLKRWSRVYFRQVLLSEKTFPIDVNLLFRKTSGDFYKKLDYEQFSKILDRGWEHVGIRLKRLMLLVLGMYRTIGTTHLGGACRFEPSCSAYSLEAIHTHPPLKALFLTIRRIVRCRPGGPWGYDPVPPCEECDRMERQYDSAK